MQRSAVRQGHPEGREPKPTTPVITPLASLSPTNFTSPLLPHRFPTIPAPILTCWPLPGKGGSGKPGAAQSQQEVSRHGRSAPLQPPQTLLPWPTPGGCALPSSWWWQGRAGGSPLGPNQGRQESSPPSCSTTHGHKLWAAICLSDRLATFSQRPPHSLWVSSLHQLPSLGLRHLQPGLLGQNRGFLLIHNLSGIWVCSSLCDFSFLFIFPLSLYFPPSPSPMRGVKEGKMIIFWFEAEHRSYSLAFIYVLNDCTAGMLLLELF